MTIYFHPKRFSPEYLDLIKVPSLESEASSKSGTPMLASAVVSDWLAKHPEGSVTITTEEK